MAQQPQECQDIETPAPSQSPMTINACVPRQDQDNIPTKQAEHDQDIQHASQSFGMLTGVARRKKRNTMKSPSTYHLGFLYSVVGQDGEGGEEGGRRKEEQGRR